MLDRWISPPTRRGGVYAVSLWTRGKLVQWWTFATWHAAIRAFAAITLNETPAGAIASGEDAAGFQAAGGADPVYFDLADYSERTGYQTPEQRLRALGATVESDELGITARLGELAWDWSRKTLEWECRTRPERGVGVHTLIAEVASRRDGVTHKSIQQSSKWEKTQAR